MLRRGITGRPLPGAALALVLLTVAYATLVQPLGCTQTSHYALVKSLADGSPTIDRYHWETCDKSFTDGHFYSAKAPGLAFLTLPPYLVMDGLGVVPESPRTAIWVLGLFGVVLPAFLLLLLIRRLAERLDPGLGLAAGVALGLGTLVLPFSTLLFSHVLATLLGFGAFALAWRERERSPSLPLLAAAGLLAGLAVTAEYPLSLVAIAVGLYALTRGDYVRRGLAYAAGALVGALPLALFNLWAFGSVTHLSYENVVVSQGQSGHDVIGAHSAGVFGITTPSLRVGLELLFSAKGLLVLAPVVAFGAVGTALLYRHGKRAEAIAIAAVAAAYLVYNSGFYTAFGGPFGGDSPGPRYLVPVLPFLAVPLALAFRRFATPAATLAGVSVLAMLAATATEPMIGDSDTGRWLDRVASADFTNTLLTLAGAGHGWAAVLPFLVLVAAAFALAARTLALRWSERHELEVTLGCLAAWALTAGVGPTLLETDRAAGEVFGLVALLLLVAALAAAVALLATRGARALVAAAPLAAFLVPEVSDHTKWALAAAAGALVLLATATLAARPVFSKRSRLS